MCERKNRCVKCFQCRNIGCPYLYNDELCLASDEYLEDLTDCEHGLVRGTNGIHADEDEYDRYLEEYELED